jgi:excisionase family DNA binding protein
MRRGVYMSTTDIECTEGGGFPELIDEVPAPIARRIWTIGAAAELLSVTQKTVRRLIDVGELRKVNIGTRVGVRDDDLAEYIERHTAG